MAEKAARESATQQQELFYGDPAAIREDADRAAVQGCLVVFDEDLTNFFPENFPQLYIGAAGVTGARVVGNDVAD
jgi:hypothetical protein